MVLRHAYGGATLADTKDPLALPKRLMAGAEESD